MEDIPLEEWKEWHQRPTCQLASQSCPPKLSLVQEIGARRLHHNWWRQSYPAVFAPDQNQRVWRSRDRSHWIGWAEGYLLWRHDGQFVFREGIPGLVKATTKIKYRVRQTSVRSKIIKNKETAKEWMRYSFQMFGGTSERPCTTK